MHEISKYSIRQFFSVEIIFKNKGKKNKHYNMHVTINSIYKSYEYVI